MKFFKQQDGISLYLTIIILVGILAIGLGITTLLLGEIQISRDIGRFIPAIYAADAGIERMLYRIRRTPDASNCDWNNFSQTDPGETYEDCKITDTLNTIDASYTVWTARTGFGSNFHTGQCDANRQCTKAVGSRIDTNRSFEVSF